MRYSRISFTAFLSSSFHHPSPSFYFLSRLPDASHGILRVLFWTREVCLKSQVEKEESEGFVPIGVCLPHSSFLSPSPLLLFPRFYFFLLLYFFFSLTPFFTFVSRSLSLSATSTSGSFVLQEGKEGRRWHPCPWLARECLSEGCNAADRRGDRKREESERGMHKSERGMHGSERERKRESEKKRHQTSVRRLEYTYNYIVLVLWVWSAWNRVEWRVQKRVVR